MDFDVVWVAILFHLDHINYFLIDFCISVMLKMKSCFEDSVVVYKVVKILSVL